jgi:hypothetical protein
MATIKLENGKFTVKAIDGRGEDVELDFDTHIEAQVIANVETANQIKYFDEFEKIDGLNQHPSGLSFKDWLRLTN